MEHGSETHRRQYPIGLAGRAHLVLVAAIALAIALVSAGSPAAVGADSPTFPVAGYFVRASTSDADNTGKLTAIKALGGDTVITFGSRLSPIGLASVPAACVIAAVNCVQSVTGGALLNRVFLYADSSPWGAPAVKCPRDRSITNNNKLFTVLVLPAQGSGCTAADSRYDVVVVSGGTVPEASATGSMARVATAQAVKFFAGMPIPANRADAAYLPDLSYQNTFSQFTDRYLQYQSAVNDVAGLAGFYLSTEMPVSDGPIFDSVLTVYRIQNQAIRRIMPTRSAVVSPYIDARAAAGGRTTPAQAQAAVRNIGLTASGVRLNIAVQDGMGTGKGGAYFGNEVNSMVDNYAAAIVGSGTWGNKYLAPVRDYFLAAAAGAAGTGATLWANMEGMAPATGANPCDSNTRGQTTKARLDRQLQQLGNAPAKVISFMWDSYYTCAGTGVPLAQSIEGGKATPVITDTDFSAATGSVLVTGYNLSGAKVQLRWTTAAGLAQDRTLAAGAYNPLFGQQRGLNPSLQSVTVNVGATSLGSGKFYMVNVTNAWGATNDAFYSKQG
ncbi:hypothetical protein [Pseudarthrobacter sp. MM222]|uniref:hypothetical protein n=1 Tax=Pseudarthrobacter sp. MM222 TaxID=3018929 RepID=UPI00221F44FC|nr:hypothetical protein [Pseudarthrobacter sp. MM222]CAI3800181.1 hypothetical protein NKCBBBOE_02519 [Pseudarthrobacter sp. MM222]